MCFVALLHSSLTYTPLLICLLQGHCPVLNLICYEASSVPTVISTTFTLRLATLLMFKQLRSIWVKMLVANVSSHGVLRAPRRQMVFEKNSRQK